MAYNAPLSFNIKEILTINKLKQLIQTAANVPEDHVYKAIMLLVFWGFYRLSTMVPTSQAAFCPSRYPTHGDVIWGSPGAHIITKCVKNMQVSCQVQVVQLPQLSDTVICPVAALKEIVSHNSRHSDKPLFILTASKVRAVLCWLVAGIGLLPSEFGYHSFRRSGASWAFDNKIDFKHIKDHGGWCFDAIWCYLLKTPSAAGAVVRTFQERLN